MCAHSDVIETMDYSLASIFDLTSGTSLERASQEEQNGANFSSIAPSSEKLWVYRCSLKFMYMYMVKVVTSLILLNIISLERASQEEQIGANFRFIAPSIWE